MGFFTFSGRDQADVKELVSSLPW